jgi:hypothetical protein
LPKDDKLELINTDSFKYNIKVTWNCLPLIRLLAIRSLPAKSTNYTVDYKNVILSFNLSFWISCSDTMVWARFLRSHSELSFYAL